MHFPKLDVTGSIVSRRNCALFCSPGAMLSDLRLVPRLRQAPALLVRAGAPHDWRRPDSGSRLRPPSGRYGFDRHFPDRLVDVRRSIVDSLVFSHRMDAVPLWWGVCRTGRSRKGRHTTDERWRHNSSAQRRPNTAIKPAPANAQCRWLSTTLARCVLSLCDPPQPERIERPGAAQVNVQTGVAAI